MLDAWDRTETLTKIDFLDAGEALARELDLLEDVSQNPSHRHVWLWESPQCLVSPKSLSTKATFADSVEEMKANGWPINLRSTGGDVTPQGAGIMNITHVYATKPGQAVDLKREYDKLCTPIEQTLGDGTSRGWQPGAFCDGEYNVQLNGLKFAGTAMRIRRGKADKTQSAVLAHAIMLIEPVSLNAIEAINQFLTLLGEDRQINIAAHASLPSEISKLTFAQKLETTFWEIPVQ